MKIRKATKKDLDALVELSDKLMLDHKKRFGYRLAINPKNIKANKFYRKLGFVPYEEFWRMKI